MTIKDITSHLESIAPISLQESYDNAGLIVGDPDMEVSSALICLDATEEIVEEAKQLDCKFIIAHHPVIFRGLKKLNGSNYVERCIIKAIRNDIAIYAIHTNLDNTFSQGVNSAIAKRLGLSNTRILSPKAIGYTGTILPNAETGAGLIGELSGELVEEDFLKNLKYQLKTQLVRHTKLLSKNIRKVAICGGSGSFLLPVAIENGADAFVTADFKYHEFFDADGKILIADVGHYESEQFTIDLLKEIIAGKFPTFALHLTKVVTNPVNYF
jgi:dinuclear metal center YbgI/SA1388 family protein